MAYIQTLIDDFGDASLDTGKWTIAQSPGASESGGKLNLQCVADYPRVEGKTYFDLSSGILAAKLSVTGTRTDNNEIYIGAHDSSGNHISALGESSSEYISFQPGGLATISNEVVTDTTIGIGPSWVAGTWWGIGNMGPDNIVRMYKSSDGQAWTEMSRCTVGGTFNKSSVALVFMAGVWDGSTSNLTANYDDASYWSVDIQTFAVRKIRWGGTWIWATPKVRVDDAWVAALPKPRVEGVWDPMT